MNCRFIHMFNEFLLTWLIYVIAYFSPEKGNFGDAVSFLECFFSLDKTESFVRDFTGKNNMQNNEGTKLHQHSLEI